MNALVGFQSPVNGAREAAAQAWSAAAAGESPVADSLGSVTVA